MSNERKAAIDLDAFEDKPLNTLSAADFLTALGSNGAFGLNLIKFWPEKKKYELYFEPENLGGLTFRGIKEKIGEKKKYELEKDLRTETHKQIGAEYETFNPQDLLTNPAFREVVTTVAREVARQLGKSTGATGTR